MCEKNLVEILCVGARIRRALNSPSGRVRNHAFELLDLLASDSALNSQVRTEFDNQVLAQRNLVETVLARSQNRLVFFELWWQQLDAERARELIQEVAAINYDRAVHFRCHFGS